MRSRAGRGALAAPLAVAAFLLVAALAAAQVGNNSTGGNGTIPVNLTPGGNLTDGNDTGGNFTPEEPVAPGSAFPVGLVLLVVGAALIVGLLVYAASRRS